MIFPGQWRKKEQIGKNAKRDISKFFLERIKKIMEELKLDDLDVLSEASLIHEVYNGPHTLSFKNLIIHDFLFKN